MTTAVVRKQGNRPSKYKQSILSELFEMLARGKTTRECCKELDVSWTTLRQWINKDEKLNQQYLQAKHDSVLYTIEDLDVLLEQAKRDPKLNMTRVKLYEIILKNMHFKASKLAPKVFGTEKQTMSIQDQKGNEFKVEWSK
jgi:transposase